MEGEDRSHPDRFKEEVMHHWFRAILAATIVTAAMTGGSAVKAQYYGNTNAQYNRLYYYPYYYFPHNYWPAMGPRWPERPGDPYQRPPAYMAYPPFREQTWRHELYVPQKYYRGQHFFLDQF
jgi:hypothetical protein